MLKNLDEVQKFGKENMDVALKSFGAVSKSMQAIAVEVADYSKKSFEDFDRCHGKTSRRQDAGKGDRGAE